MSGECCSLTVAVLYISDVGVSFNAPLMTKSLEKFLEVKFLSSLSFIKYASLKCRNVKEELPMEEFLRRRWTSSDFRLSLTGAPRLLNSYQIKFPFRPAARSSGCRIFVCVLSRITAASFVPIQKQIKEM